MKHSQRETALMADCSLERYREREVDWEARRQNTAEKTMKRTVV